MRMLGDLPSASHLSFVAVSWLRRDSDRFVAGRVYSYRANVEMDLWNNQEAEDRLHMALACYGDEFPEEHHRDLLKIGICKDLRNESGRSEFHAVFVEIFSNPAFGRTLREKAAINLSLSEIFHHDVAAAELRVRQLPQLLPENELWRSFALGLIERSRGELTSAESLFRKAAEGFLALGQSVSWAFILLHACHARCQLGELPVSEIQAVADFLATSMRMKGGAAQAAQLRAACADRHAAAQIVGSVLFSLRCPHATNRQDWHRGRSPT
jgi:tetratricopeptide (TPR) repeat protein